VNFFGHATLAAAQRPEPSFVLGAMLPDLAAMAGDRIASVADPVVRSGVAFHHETDAAFHVADPFVALCVSGRQALEAAGVGRGAARAVAHVGSELLLDGWIARTQGISPHYDAALARGPALESALRWRRGIGERHWASLCARIEQSPIPTAYDDPAFVCERLVRILSRRPRLALVPAELPAVRQWLAGAREALPRSAASLLQAAANINFSHRA